MQINSLSSENESLKSALKAAQKKEMDAVKQLAVASKKVDVRAARATAMAPPTASSANPAAKRRIERTHSPPDSSRKISNTGAAFKRINLNEMSQQQQPPVILHTRPHSEASKIPFPSSLSESYLGLLQSIPAK